MKLLEGINEMDSLPTYDEVAGNNAENPEENPTLIPTDSPKQEPQSQGIVKPLIKAINEKFGIWKEEELESIEDTTEELLNKLEEATYTIADSKVDEYIQTTVQPFNQRLLSLLEEGVPEDRVIQLGKERLAFKDVSKEDIKGDLAEKAYRIYLQKTTKFTPERINKEVQTKKDLDILNDEAQEIYDDLNSIFIDEEKQEVKRIKDYEDSVQQKAISRINLINEQIDNMESIGNIKLTEKHKRELKKHFLPIQTEKGTKTYLQSEREKDPVSFDIAFNALSALNIVKYDGRAKKFVLDFSNVADLGKNKVMEELEEAVNKKRGQEKVQTGHSKTLTTQLTEEEQIQQIIKNKSKFLKNV